MDRLTKESWRNLDPWECCGQDDFCKRDCHAEGGCNNGCVVPINYVRLSKYEDIGTVEEFQRLKQAEIARQPPSEEVRAAIKRFQISIPVWQDKIDRLAETIEKYPWEKISSTVDDWRPLEIKALKKLIAEAELIIAALRQYQPKPTSEAVQAAIGWVKNTRSGDVYMSGSWIAQMREEITREIQQTILDALRQLTEPTDEAVKDSLKKLTYSRELDREFDDGTFVTALDTAIYALRQYQPQECDMCESWAAWLELNCPKTMGVPWRFTNCPSCGKELRKE